MQIIFTEREKQLLIDALNRADTPLTRQETRDEWHKLMLKIKNSMIKG